MTSLHGFRGSEFAVKGEIPQIHCAAGPFRSDNRLEVPGAGRTLPSTAAPRLGEKQAVETLAFRCIAPAGLERAIEIEEWRNPNIEGLRGRTSIHRRVSRCSWA